MFDVEIWGNVSDWLAILINFGVGWFIYRTFKSQLIVTESQLKLLNIEQMRYRRQLRPQFELTSAVRDSSSGFLLYLTLKNHTENEAIKIHFINNNGYFPVQLGQTTLTEVKANSDKVIINGIQIPYENNPKYDFNIIFSDIDGSQYFQTVTGYIENASITSPIYKEDVL